MQKPHVPDLAWKSQTFFYQKNPYAHKNKSALPPRLSPKMPTPKRRTSWACRFSCRKTAKTPGSHKIGAAISVPELWAKTLRTRGFFRFYQTGEHPGDHNHRDFPKTTAIRMGGVLQYKWEAYCHTNERSTDSTSLSSDNRVAESIVIQMGSVLQYKWEVYFDTFFENLLKIFEPMTCGPPLKNPEPVIFRNFSRATCHSVPWSVP